MFPFCSNKTTSRLEQSDFFSQWTGKKMKIRLEKPVANNISKISAKIKKPTKYQSKLQAERVISQQESPKLRALRGKNVLAYQRALRAHVPCVLTCSLAKRALRVYVLTCQHALRAYALTCHCLACLRAHVLTCLASLPAFVAMCLV